MYHRFLGIPFLLVILGLAHGEEDAGLQPVNTLKGSGNAVIEKTVILPESPPLNAVEGKLEVAPPSDGADVGVEEKPWHRGRHGHKKIKEGKQKGRWHSKKGHRRKHKGRKHGKKGKHCKSEGDHKKQEKPE
ncbi:skin granule protein-like [Xenopus laevis]|uniref:Uncharacterized protein n=2 Tax=Xenopus laevis TaxID=8355 RepID=A0A974DKL3_XENLA|nr:skin granule protein-like [Xenopus laevis]OCT93698.1 hypothetical protein XELAEV_18011373mg [Xenopus laevis]